MRPLEPGSPARRVRALDPTHGTGLKGRRAGDDAFRDLLDDALDRDAPQPDTPEEPGQPEDPVELGPVEASESDGLDRVEIRSRELTRVTGEPKADAAPGIARTDREKDTPATTPPPEGGPHRLDLKA